MMKWIITIFFAVTSSTLYAGGSYFTIKITSFDQSEESFELMANVIGHFNYDRSNCGVLKLAGDYDQKRWKNYTKLINRDIHLNSLDILKDAYINSKVINLGYIGGGFQKIGPCSYRSKGLFQHGESVLSIYRRI